MSNDKSKNISRRQVMKTVVIGGVATMVMLPSKWTKPVVDTVITPAHAASSAPATTAAPPPPTTTTAAPPPPV